MKTWIAIAFTLLALTARAQDDQPIGPDRAEKVLLWMKEHHPDWYRELRAWQERGEEERVQEALRKFAWAMENEGKSEKDAGAEKLARYERVLVWLVGRDPERAAMLKTLIGEKRVDVIEREFRDVFEAFEHEVRRAAEAAKDPEARERQAQNEKLETAARELAEAYRRATGPDRETLRKRLRETLAQLFEVREWFRRRELERLQKEIEQMRRLLEERQANRDRIIEKRLAEMIGEGDPLDW